jgi:2-succinyl-6-hydroxy-2,4-cyclohexadiene-1-carboxylate synthase
MHVVLLHGFAQTGATWRRVVDIVHDTAPDLRLHTPTLPGHGAVPTPALTVERAAESLAGFAAGIPAAIWVGYSMGARHALRVALDHPHKVAALVTIGATPGLPEADERAARQQLDEATAREIESVGTEAFLARWVTQPLFGGVEDQPIAQRAANGTAAGWASSLRRAGTGVMEPMWRRLPEVAVPCRFLAGEHDDKFARIAHDMAALVAPARAELVPGAFHNAHASNPALVAAGIVELARSTGHAATG